MAAIHKKDYSLDEMELKYHAITTLYDLADDLIATVESPFVRNQEAQMNLVEPLVVEIGEAADVLAEEFILVAESRRGSSKKPNKIRIENALRRLFSALNDHQEKAKAAAAKGAAQAYTLVDAIIRKIEHQLEEVLVVFLEFISISLASIMHKQQLEAVRARDPRIAMMMHQHALSQQ